MRSGNEFIAYNSRSYNSLHMKKETLKSKPKVKAAAKAPAPNQRLTEATGKLETIAKEMQARVQDATSVEERQGIINRINEVVTELKS